MAGPDATSAAGCGAGSAIAADAVTTGAARTAAATITRPAARTIGEPVREDLLTIPPTARITLCSRRSREHYRGMLATRTIMESHEPLRMKTSTPIFSRSSVSPPSAQCRHRAQRCGNDKKGRPDPSPNRGGPRDEPTTSAATARLVPARYRDRSSPRCRRRRCRRAPWRCSRSRNHCGATGFRRGMPRAHRPTGRGRSRRR